MEQHTIQLSKTPFIIRENVSYDAKLSQSADTFDTPTLQLFGALEKAVKYFEANLFTKPLTPFILILNKNIRSRGYYQPNAWIEHGHLKLPEICIHPSLLLLDCVEVMQTLVHEMMHHYHFQYGSPGAQGYHNKEFAAFMREVGLICSHTGKLGGKFVGRHMTQYVLPGGLFETVFKKMPVDCKVPFEPAEQTRLSVAQIQVQSKQERIRQQKQKTKYSCLSCAATVWGKAMLSIICGQCKEAFVVIDDFGKTKKYSTP